MQYGGLIQIFSSTAAVRNDITFPPVGIFFAYEENIWDLQSLQVVRLWNVSLTWPDHYYAISDLHTPGNETVNVVP
jgi:hypothetical protein